MSELESLRAFVNVRLIAAAEEICGAVEKTIAEFVETFTERQNKMLNIVIKPGFTQDVLVQNVEEEVTYFQEQPEPLLIKEEEEHVLISQEATSLDVQGSGVPEPSADCQPLSSDCSEAECEDGEDHDNAVENGPMSRSGLGELLKDGAKRSYEETEGSESDFETSELNKSTKSCEKTESQGGYDPCQCKVCGKFFRYKANLIKHASFHTNNQEFLCGICGERQDSSENLTLHLKSHVKGRKICPTCGKSYSSTALLKVHSRIHTGEKPYKCNSCHKHFTHRTACVRHIMAVHPEKMCCAGECGKEFSDQRHLNQHMAAHRGKKPYNCNDCGKGFKFVGRLERK